MKAQFEVLRKVHNQILDDHSTMESEHEAMMKKHDEIRKSLIDSNPEGEQIEE